MRGDEMVAMANKSLISNQPGTGGQATYGRMVTDKQ